MSNEVERIDEDWEIVSQVAIRSLIFFDMVQKRRPSRWPTRALASLGVLRASSESSLLIQLGSGESRSVCGSKLGDHLILEIIIGLKPRSSRRLGTETDETANIYADSPF